MNILSISCYLASLAVVIFGWATFLDGSSVAAIDVEAMAVRLEDKIERELDGYVQRYQTRQETAARDDQFDERFERLQTIEITSTSRGYWLVAPKLMLAVDDLGGGDLRIKYADRFEQIRIAQRLDVEIEGDDCFLLLVESVRGKAVFQFGCDKGPVEKFAIVAR